MLQYYETYKALKALQEKGQFDKLEAMDFFLYPFAISLNYSVGTLLDENKPGKMLMKHSNGTVEAYPDENSKIVFSCGEPDLNTSENIIYVCLKENLDIDLFFPRFGKLSKYYTLNIINQEDGESDKDSYEELCTLLEYNEKSSDRKNFSKSLQLKVDLAISNDNAGEEMRSIKQILNQALQKADEDLIRLIAYKINNDYDFRISPSPEDMNSSDDPELCKLIKKKLLETNEQGEHLYKVIYGESFEKPQEVEEKPEDVKEQTKADVKLAFYGNSGKTSEVQEKEDKGGDSDGNESGSFKNFIQ